MCRPAVVAGRDQPKGKPLPAIRLILEQNRTEVGVAERLLIDDTAAAYRCLDQALARGRPILLDAVDLMRIDTAGVQLLAIFCLTVRQRGLGPQWRGISSTLREVVDQLGLPAVLGLPPEANDVHPA